jgi:hypothetical protein
VENQFSRARASSLNSNSVPRINGYDNLDFDDSGLADALGSKRRIPPAIRPHQPFVGRYRAGIRRHRPIIGRYRRTIHPHRSTNAQFCPIIHPHRATIG